MSKDLPHESDPISPASYQRVDRLCLQFEDAWKAGQRPRLEQFLGDTAEPERSQFLKELLLVEVFYRRRTGEQPIPDEYHARFPDHARVVAEALRSAGPATQPLGGTDVLPEPPGVSGELRRSAGSHGQFLPGHVLAGRYRIVGLVGRGGMGEVYRADDLKLGQPVALKFISQDLAGDPRQMEFLRNEVRLARQVAHPNVCRVYDIGEVEGSHFLSMEYVDGEDLARLLRRIGRLPHDKAIVIAKQLCAGLTAAHDRGILHCDLKPANVMLDGRGQVRMTDFGLARLSDAALDEEIRAGTPAYMAPEQLAGEPVTVRSDIYSLGLVLYEIFTGKPVFPTVPLKELFRIRKERSVPEMPFVLEGLDPAVERVILHCLEPDPHDRPASARAVLAALPGVRPLEALLAAGETPSPEAIAAAGQEAGIPLRYGLLCGLGILLGLLAVMLLSDATMLVDQTDLKKPDALAERASDIVKELGYREPPKDHAYGFVYAAGEGGKPTIQFWYRQSPSTLVPELFAGSLTAAGSYSAKAQGTVSLVDPPPGIAGETSVVLDPQGRLIEFRAVPSASEEDQSESPSSRGASSEPKPAAGYTALFRRAGLVEESDRGIDPAKFPSSQLTGIIPVPCDAWSSWKRVDPKAPAPLDVVAASYRDRPVYFRVSPSGPAGVRRSAPGFPPVVFEIAVAMIALPTIAAAIVLVRRNLRRGRGDRRGAFRLACYVFAVSMLAWLLQTSRGAQPALVSVLVMGAQIAVYRSVLLWLFYLALEPYVRRLWPETLISWNRLLVGRFRDPLVGRDVLVGLLLGVATRVLWQINALAPSWLGLGPPSLFGPQRSSFRVPLQTLLGTRYCLGQLFQFHVSAVSGCLFVLLFLFLLRLVLRKQWLAACGYVLIWTPIWSIGVGHPYVSWFAAGVSCTLVVFLLTRFGLVALISYTCARLMLNYPITADLSIWYAGGTTVLPLAVILALAGWALHTAVGDGPSPRVGLAGRQATGSSLVA